MHAAFPTTPRSEGGERMPESEDGKERGIRFKGWEIRSRRSGIADAAQIDTFESELSTKHLPELLFADAFLELRHPESGVAIGFSALEALRGWRTSPEYLTPIQVPVSKPWQASRKKDLADLQVKALNYDWTFTTPYSGHLAQPGLAWSPTGDKIDRELLMRKEAILFYDDVSLYESELDDHGMSKLAIKVRVMPTCWYVLLRYWLRVDEVLVRIRDTRLFCPFGQDGGTPKIIKETKHSEATFQELGIQGAPVTFTAHFDSDSSSACFESIAPFGVRNLQVLRLERQAATQGQDGEPMITG